MTQKTPDSDGSSSPLHVADLLQNFALRTLVVRAQATGMTKPQFLEAVGLAWDSVPPEKAGEWVDLIKKVATWWTSDDDPSPGKKGGS
jgi:hypothetical protein